VTDAPVWVADVNQYRSDAARVCLGVVLDVFHRRVMGWATDDVLDTGQVLNAFQTARQVRRPEPWSIPHSDQGTPYGSLRFGGHLRASAVRWWPLVGGVTPSACTRTSSTDRRTPSETGFPW